MNKGRTQAPHKMRTPRQEDVASPPGRRLPISHKMRKHRQKMWSPHRGLGAGTPHLAPRATSAEPQAVAPPPIDSAGRILPGGDRGTNVVMNVNVVVNRQNFNALCRRTSQTLCGNSLKRSGFRILAVTALEPPNKEAEVRFGKTRDRSKLIRGCLVSEELLKTRD